MPLPLRLPRSPRLTPIAALVVALAALLLPVGVSPTAVAEPAVLEVGGLTTNGRTDPLGIPGEAPSFGWSSTSTARGVVQSAYQLRVAGSEDELGAGDLWDSGKVASDRQVDVVYGGPPLASQTRYVWQVRVWDGDDQASAWSDPASFETGMLTAADWDGAEWISAADGTEVNRWTDYTAEFDFTIENHAFGTFVRAANTGNGYMWQLSVADGTPRFRPHVRVNGGYSLLDNKDISSVISAQDLRTGQHTMTVQVDGSTITTSLDGTQIDSRTDATHAKGFVGFRSDHANGTFEKFTARRVEVTAKSGETLLDTDFSGGNPFSAGVVTDAGLVLDQPTDALYVSSDDHRPLLRTDFDTAAGKTVTRARVYASARGVYELNLNGEKVGDQFLAPGWTDYADRIQHQTYDVTDLVDSGSNSFGAELADGWWSGKVGMWGPDVYGDRLSLIARLRIDYSDGTSEWVDTDGSWTADTGPYVFTDNIDGETYDARHEQPGWDQSGFDDSGWQPVDVVAPATDLLVPQGDEPVRVTEELAVVERTEPTPGAFIYDLGQNMVGVARMVLQGQAGDTVRVRYGEVLNPDGTLYTANLRAAKVTDRYTFAADGTVTYEPKFTQHGFRYVEITGAAVPPAPADVTGVVWGSDLPATGTLETSSSMLNQLVSNISWGQRGNFLSIPTDTPARDERLGWTGDINVFAPTANYLRDTRAFLAKWMHDMSDTQFANGDLPGIAPEPPGVGCCGSGTGWSDAGITVPYSLWDSFGDASVAREFYPEMTAFMDYLRGHAGADLIDPGRGGWGDWLNLDDPTPTAVMGTAYLAEDARMMSEMAAAIGADADAAEYAQLSADVRAAFAEEFIGPDGTVSGDSQTGYAMALGMDLVPDGLRDEVGARFVDKLAASDHHLTTGFLGTPWLLPALSSIDRDDLAYTLLMHEDYPSWGYEVRMGATTMWERWNSIMPDGTFGDVSMNSFNHYAYGAVGDWMYQNIGGIAAVEPGYKTSRIAPVVGGGLTHGSGELTTVYGRIATDWAVDGEDLSLAVEVPVNTTAEVVLPAESEWSVTEGGQLLADVEGVVDVTAENGEVVVTVGSGSYDFDVVAANDRLGAILDSIAALRTHVADTEADGDLAGEHADHLDGGLAGAADDVTAAVLAGIDGDEDAVTAELGSALTSVRALRDWLPGSGVDGPVRRDLDGRLAGIEAQLVTALTSHLGVAVALPPVLDPVLPGSTAEGTLDVTAGDSPLSDVSAEVTVDGWDGATVETAAVPAGGTAQLPVSLSVPDDAEPSSYDATVAVTFTLDGETYTVEEATEDWLTVTSGVTIGDVTGEAAAADPPERGELTVEVRNEGDAAVSGHLRAEVPEGWSSVPSDEVVVPAGETRQVPVPVVLPLDVVGGATPVSVELVSGGTVLAAEEATPSFDLATPPAAEVYDHVDFGDTASETAHALEASPFSGTNVEAGLTRRYAHTDHPGSWYSVALEVPAGEPFLLRSRETFDGPWTKRYHVYVDDVLVTTKVVPRAEGGQGWKPHSILVDDPAVLDNDGTVRVRFEYPADAEAGTYDPSLADTWVLAVPEDTVAPEASAQVVAGARGANGWWRSDATVAVSSADGRDPAPRVDVGLSAGWQSYAGPVAVTGEGEHAVSFRATDASGNTTGERTLEVRIDGTAPETELAVTRPPGVEGSDRATLTLSATDEVSGVAATTYRVDGGAWQLAGEGPAVVEGYGEHVVEYASTDVAGNREPVRRTTVTLADVDEVAALAPPQVLGVPQVGTELTATTGSWNTKGLAFGYRWLRDGEPVAGATGATYRLGRGDLGSRISVEVTASKTGLPEATATSAATAPVAKAASTTVLALSRTRVRPGEPVRVTAEVTATGLTPTGRVAVLVDGRKVRTVRLAGGSASTTVRLDERGRHRVQVRYLGSATVAGSTSAAQVLQVR